MSKYLISAIAGLAAAITSANAAPMMIGGVNYDTDNAAVDVVWAQGGNDQGLLSSYREPCDTAPLRDDTVGATGLNCRADEAAGFNKETVELDDNNPANGEQPDVIAAYFDNPLVNGAGVDLIVFEGFNQMDMPVITATLNGVQLIGVFLGLVDIDGKDFGAWGFDFSDAPLNVLADAMISEPIYIQTFRDAQNTPVGTSDIGAIVGVNFGMPPPPVPLPAAAPLFFAGLAGLGFAGRRRKKIG